MAGIKITELPVLTTPANDDKLYIVDVSDTSESAEGTSKQIKKGDLMPTLTSTDNSITIDNTDPSAPDLSIANPSIPLAGTEEGAPLTGIIRVGSLIPLAEWTNDDEVLTIGMLEGDFVFQRVNSVTGDENRFVLGQAGADGSMAFLTVNNGSVNGGMNVIASSSDIELAFKSTKIGFFNKQGLGSTQASSIPNATNATDVITSLNSLLAAMRAYGLIAE